jgi:hypothetical protein
LLSLLLDNFNVTYRVVDNKIPYNETHDFVAKDGKKILLNATEKLEKFEQLDQINAVYIAAISGSLALGGTLIAQLWGRSK